MPATAADIARATRAAVTDTQSDSAVLARQAGARDGLASPRPGYWDAIADAGAVNTAAFALIGTERRRFAVVVQDVVDLDISLATPAIALVDAVLAVNGNFLIARAEFNDDAGTTTFEVFG